MSKATSTDKQRPITEHSGKKREERRLTERPIPELHLLGWSHLAESVMKGLVGHRHPGQFEICYIERGALTWWVKDEIFELGPGDIYITWPDELHGGVDGVMHPADIYWCIFEFPPDHPPLGLSATESKALLGAFNALSHRRCQGHPGIGAHYRRILDAAATPEALRPLAVRASLHLLLLDVLAAFDQARLSGTGPRRYAPRVAKAVEILHQHIGTPLLTEDIAEAVGLRPSYFREEFKNETGFSPVQFLNLN